MPIEAYDECVNSEDDVPANGDATIPALRQKHELLKSQASGSFMLRMHRALSWLERASAAGDDDDIAFLCLWIAFNAAYAKDMAAGFAQGTRNEMREFIDNLCESNGAELLERLVWKEFPGPIRVLLDNQFVFQQFWDAHRLTSTDGVVPDFWITDFENSRRRVHGALSNHQTNKVLLEVFTRLYTLRNQLVHGGATWNSRVNRTQIRDGRAILSKVLPAMFTIMQRHHERFQISPAYPVV
jgi:hypothetical protein